MQYRSPRQLVALVLAAVVSAPAAFAEGVPTPPVMTDVAPLPPQERSSIGAVVLVDSPVLAQRDAMRMSAVRYAQVLRDVQQITLALQGLPATRMMGGPPLPTPAPQEK